MQIQIFIDTHSCRLTAEQLDTMSEKSFKATCLVNKDVYKSGSTKVNKDEFRAYSRKEQWV